MIYIEALENVYMMWVLYKKMTLKLVSIPVWDNFKIV